MTFEELYYKVLEESIRTGKSPEIKPEYDSYHIDCLLHLKIPTGNSCR